MEAIAIGLSAVWLSYKWVIKKQLASVYSYIIILRLLNVDRPFTSLYNWEKVKS